MDITEYLNDHIEFAKKGRAVNWQEVAINIYQAMESIIKDRDKQIAELVDPRPTVLPPPPPPPQ